MRKLLLAAALAAPLAIWAEAYTSGTAQIEQASGSITVSGKAKLHITGRAPIAPGAAIDLQGENAWLYFDAIKPSVVRDTHLSAVTIDGAPAAYPANVRLAQWGSGAVVIPYGTAYDDHALTVYDQIGCRGNSKQFEIFTRHTDLGEWDNRIKSIKLRHGYMATLANNPDGTGHSRCFIADDGDLQIDILPEGFLAYNGDDGQFVATDTQSFVSFIRVVRWEWTGKKGWGGWNATELTVTNIDSYYPWGASMLPDQPQYGFYQMDHEFVPIKQQQWWPSDNEIRDLHGVSHLLGYNEPNMSDQANAKVETAIWNWPTQMLMSGLRLGSPAPSSVYTNWSDEFWRLINLLNYRCDLNVSHIYEYIDGNTWRQRINHMVDESGGRPCWVTEYNNGANWTGETWPGGGRGPNDANLEHMRQWTEKILPALDGIDKLERAFIFNWVEECRAMTLIDSDSAVYLTPAGEIFANHISVPGYKPSQAYDHVWKIAPPYYSAKPRSTKTAFNLKMYDHNGETGTQYEIFYKGLEDEWLPLKTYVRGDDYTDGATITKTLSMPHTECAPTIAIRATSYNGQLSAWSDETCMGSERVGKPGNLHMVSAEEDRITIAWNPVEGATGYVIKQGRATADMPVVATTTELTYTASGLESRKPYFFSVGAYSADSPVCYCGNIRCISAVNSIADVLDEAMTIRAEAGCLVIESPVGCELPVYSIDGRTAITVSVEPGTTIVPGLPRGLYIANRQKIAL